MTQIDSLVFSRLQQLGIHPADVCSDAVFIRRTYFDVIGTLPVLVVDGAPAKRLADSASAFVDLALTPGPEQTLSTPASGGSNALNSAALSIMSPKVIPVSDLAGVEDLSIYRAVILADVPRLVLPAWTGWRNFEHRPRWDLSPAMTAPAAMTTAFRASIPSFAKTPKAWFWPI